MSEIKKYRLREVVEAWQFNINDYRAEGIPKIFESDNIVGKLDYNVLYLHRKSTNDYLTSLHDGDYVIFKNGKFSYRATKEDWEEQFEEVITVQIQNGDKSVEDYVSKDDIDNVVGESRELDFEIEIVTDNKVYTYGTDEVSGEQMEELKIGFTNGMSRGTLRMKDGSSICFNLEYIESIAFNEVVRD